MDSDGFDNDIESVTYNPDHLSCGFCLLVALMAGAIIIDVTIAFLRSSF